MLRLVGTDTKKAYKWDLAPGRYLVGRKQECDFYVLDDTVSRAHAEVEVSTDNTVFLTDLNSRNGTTVNGVRLLGRTTLADSDAVVFGAAEFRLTTEATETGSSSYPTATRLSETDPEASVIMSIDEASKPLPSKITELPGLFPTLSELARILVLHEPRDVMLGYALTLVSRVIPAQRLAVLTTSEDLQEITTEAALLPDDKDPGTFTLSRTIINDILTLKQAVLVGDPQKDHRYAQRQSIVSSDLKSAMAVPLFDEGRVLGILYVDTTNPLHHYNHDYLRLLLTFGNIIASRLINYELLEERQEKQAMEAELERASRIQKRLLITEGPEVPGYSAHAYQVQCRMVGGDLYDMTRLPDGRFLFLVGDVSGKGMGAALLMSNILASFRILYAESDLDIAQATSQVSRQLWSYSNLGDFATIFMGVIEPENHRLTYVNAGHNPALLMGRDGSRKYLSASGFMIGAFDFGEWSAESVNLEPGDLLFVYSDGVTEAEGAAGQYGDDRLDKVISDSHLLSLDDVTDRIMCDIGQFVKGTPQSDDITMLLVRRSE